MKRSGVEFLFSPLEPSNYDSLRRLHFFAMRMLAFPLGLSAALSFGDEPKQIFPRANAVTQTQAGEPLATFRVDPRLYQSFAATVYTDVDQWKDGAHVTGRVTTAVHSSPGESANTIATRIQASVAGNTTAVSTQDVPRATRRARRRLPERTVTATIPNQISGSGEVTVYLSDNTASASNIRTGANVQLGEPQISPAGFVSRIGVKAAMNRGTSIASSTAQARVPQEEAQLNDQIRQAMQQAVDEVQKRATTEVARLTAIPEVKDLQQQYSARMGSSQSGAEVALFSRQGAKERSPRPVIPDASNKAADFSIHQDFVNEAVSKKLTAMKTMKLSKALAEICSDPTMKKFPLCAGDLEGALANIDVTFDENDPFKIEFREGKIRLTLNAVHAMAVVRDGKEETRLDGNPYHIEIEYRVTDQAFERTRLAVTPRDATPAATSTATAEGAKPQTHTAGLGDFALDLLRKTSRAVRSIAEPAETEGLQRAYEGAFKERVEYKRVSVPTRVTLTNPTPQTEPTIVSEVELYPGWVHSEAGWFAGRIDQTPKKK